MGPWSLVVLLDIAPRGISEFDLITRGPIDLPDPRIGGGIVVRIRHFLPRTVHDPRKEPLNSLRSVAGFSDTAVGLRLTHECWNRHPVFVGCPVQILHVPTI